MNPYKVPPPAPLPEVIPLCADSLIPVPEHPHILASVFGAHCTKCCSSTRFFSQARRNELESFTNFHEKCRSKP